MAKLAAFSNDGFRASVMKQVVPLAAWAILAACSPAAESDRPTAKTAADIQSAAAITAADGAAAGATEICYREEVRVDGIWYSTKAGTDDTAIIERIAR